MEPARSLLFGDRPRVVLHPMLLAAVYVLSMAVNNEVRVADTLRPLGVAVAAATLLLLILWALLRDRWNAALAASAIVVVSISLVPALRVTQFLERSMGPARTSALVVLALVVVLGTPGALALRAVRRGHPVPRPAPGMLNAFAVAFLIVVLLPAVPRLLPQPSVPSQFVANAVQVTAVDPPDIVLILLDGYPRSDVLERRLGLSNRDFLDGLTARGFDVAAASRSNYVFTSTTLASMFQMRHLVDVEALQPLIGKDGAHRAALRDAANRGAAIDVLRRAGYRIVTSPAGWVHTTLAPAADEVLDHGELTDIERFLIERTWLVEIVELVAPSYAAGSQRDRIVHAFHDLEAYAGTQRDGPALYFAHIPAPHLPPVLEADGTARDLPSRAFEGTAPDRLGMSREEYVQAWRDELTYLNGRVLEVVDALQAAPEPPVIVVLSDHGYANEAADDDLQARFANLFAAYTPGAEGLLADAPTPVNLLPRLFNHYLGTDLPLNPDRYFVASVDERPLLLTEVDDPERIPSDPTIR